MSGTEPGGEGHDPGGPEHRERLERTLSGKTDRRLRAREEGDRGIWFGLGMMGLVGWSVAIPTLLGIAAGIWIDGLRSDVDETISWTLTGLVLGVALGCVNAWFWIRRELEVDE